MVRQHANPHAASPSPPPTPAGPSHPAPTLSPDSLAAKAARKEDRRLQRERKAIKAQKKAEKATKEFNQAAPAPASDATPAVAAPTPAPATASEPVATPAKRPEENADTDASILALSAKRTAELQAMLAKGDLSGLKKAAPTSIKPKKAAIPQAVKKVKAVTTPSSKRKAPELAGPPQVVSAALAESAVATAPPAHSHPAPVASTSAAYVSATNPATTAKLAKPAKAGKKRSRAADADAVPATPATASVTKAAAAPAGTPATVDVESKEVRQAAKRARKEKRRAKQLASAANSEAGSVAGQPTTATATATEAEDKSSRKQRKKEKKAKEANKAEQVNSSVPPSPGHALLARLAPTASTSTPSPAPPALIKKRKRGRESDAAVSAPASPSSGARPKKRKHLAAASASQPACSKRASSEFPTAQLSNANFLLARGLQRGIAASRAASEASATSSWTSGVTVAPATATGHSSGIDSSADGFTFMGIDPLFALKDAFACMFELARAPTTSKGEVRRSPSPSPESEADAEQAIAVLIAQMEKREKKRISAAGNSKALTVPAATAAVEESQTGSEAEAEEDRMEVDEEAAEEARKQAHRSEVNAKKQAKRDAKLQKEAAAAVEEVYNEAADELQEEVQLDEDDHVPAPTSEAAVNRVNGRSDGDVLTIVTQVPLSPAHKAPTFNAPATPAAVPAAAESPPSPVADPAQSGTSTPNRPRPRQRLSQREKAERRASEGPNKLHDALARAKAAAQALPPTDKIAATEPKQADEVEAPVATQSTPGKVRFEFEAAEAPATEDSQEDQLGASQYPIENRGAKLPTPESEPEAAQAEEAEVEDEEPETEPEAEVEAEAQSSQVPQISRIAPSTAGSSNDEAEFEEIAKSLNANASPRASYAQLPVVEPLFDRTRSPSPEQSPTKSFAVEPTLAAAVDAIQEAVEEQPASSAAVDGTEAQAQAQADESPSTPPRTPTPPPAVATIGGGDDWSSSDSEEDDEDSSSSEDEVRQPLSASQRPKRLSIGEVAAKAFARPKKRQSMLNPPTTGTPLKRIPSGVPMSQPRSSQRSGLSAEVARELEALSKPSADPLLAAIATPLPDSANESGSEFSEIESREPSPEVEKVPKKLGHREDSPDLISEDENQAGLPTGALSGEAVAAAGDDEDVTMYDVEDLAGARGTSPAEEIEDADEEQPQPGQAQHASSVVYGRLPLISDISEMASSQPPTAIGVDNDNSQVVDADEDGSDEAGFSLMAQDDNTGQPLFLPATQESAGEQDEESSQTVPLETQAFLEQLEAVPEADLPGVPEIQVDGAEVEAEAPTPKRAAAELNSLASSQPTATAEVPVLRRSARRSVSPAPPTEMSESVSETQSQLGLAPTPSATPARRSARAAASREASPAPTAETPKPTRARKSVANGMLIVSASQPAPVSVTVSSTPVANGLAGGRAKRAVTAEPAVAGRRITRRASTMQSLSDLPELGAKAPAVRGRASMSVVPSQSQGLRKGWGAKAARRESEAESDDE